MRTADVNPLRPLRQQREVSGEDDLSAVQRLELVVDTTESSLGRLGSLVPHLKELKLSGSRVATVRCAKFTLQEAPIKIVLQEQL